MNPDPQSKSMPGSISNLIRNSVGTRREFLRATGQAAALLALQPRLSAADVGENSIVRENRKQGTRDWLLTRLEPARGDEEDAPWQRRAAIEGFCSHPSIRAGETLRVYVSTNPVSRYRAEIYRMGYYGGDGGRHVRSMGPLSGSVQPTPTDESKQLVQCQWKVGFELEIPADWLSGVYLGKLTAADSGYESYFIFIVRDDRKADFLFQCSDTTWQAYNRWPAWRSLYDWQQNKWHTSPGADISFDRPYSLYYNKLPAGLVPLTNGSGEFLLWEYPLSFWMEKEGYDVTYISNLDTHTDPKGLLRGKGFLSVGHDEYWSLEMFSHVAAARDAGVHLAFLSGNSVSGKILFRPGADGRPNRIFGRYSVDGSHHFRNDQDLMGVSSYGVGAADWTCRAPDHWMFEGTGMKDGDSIPQLVGWEYHGPPMRDDPSLVVLARGKTRRGQQETNREYASVLYTAPKGNFVFNAATCWWNMPLSRPPGAVNPPRTDFSREDRRVQRITKNLLDRMLRS
jgi:hypothetical protein